MTAGMPSTYRVPAGRSRNRSPSPAIGASHRRSGVGVGSRRRRRTRARAVGSGWPSGENGRCRGAALRIEARERRQARRDHQADDRHRHARAAAIRQPPVRAGGRQLRRRGSRRSSVAIVAPLSRHWRRGFRHDFATMRASPGRVPAGFREQWTASYSCSTPITSRSTSATSGARSASSSARRQRSSSTTTTRSARATEVFRAPSVIRLQHRIKRPRPRVRLSRREIFVRDKHTCQYCGVADARPDARPRHPAPPRRRAHVGQPRRRVQALQPPQGRPARRRGAHAPDARRRSSRAATSTRSSRRTSPTRATRPGATTSSSAATERPSAGSMATAGSAATAWPTCATSSTRSGDNGHAAYVVGGGVRDALLGRTGEGLGRGHRRAARAHRWSCFPAARYDEPLRHGHRSGRTARERRGDDLPARPLYADHRRPRLGHVHRLARRGPGAARLHGQCDRLGHARPAPITSGDRLGRSDRRPGRPRRATAARRRRSGRALRRGRAAAAARGAAGGAARVRDRAGDAGGDGGHGRDRSSGCRASASATSCARMLEADPPSRGVRDPRRTGVLEHALPELAAQRGVAAGQGHRASTCGATAWPRSTRAAQLRSGQATAAPGRAAARHRQAARRSPTATSSATTTEGAELAEALLAQARLPAARDRARVVELVRHHMFSYEPRWSGAAVRRFIRRVGRDLVDDLIDLRARRQHRQRPAGQRRPPRRAARARSTTSSAPARH